jgi:diguanylate cyclase (GGDEF)-like protein
LSAQRKDDPAADAVLARAESVVRDKPGQEELAREYAGLAKKYRELSRKFYKTLHISDGYQKQVKDLALRLEKMLLKNRQLSELVLPLCVHCGKVQTDDAYWQRLETFLSRNADFMFDKRVCPDCLAKVQRGLGQPVKPPVDAPGKHGPQAANVKSKQELADEKYIEELRHLVEKAAATDAALGGSLGKFLDRHAKISRRFSKILTISDSYQSQLRDFTQRLELLARTDVLTGLANRWEMTNRLEVEESRIRRHGSSFSIILGDIDHFKEVNDTHGHAAGDLVLRRVAQVMREALRAEDLCARWGGEEFLILLPEARLAQAKAVAEKLAELVRQNEIDWEGTTIAITMSFGVVEIGPDSSVDACIRLVDDAMYAAKARGRNQVVAAGD